MEAFARFENECELPLYYNGDIITAGDIDGVMKDFPRLRGVMIGRGLLANPALAREWRSGELMPEAEFLEALGKIHGEVYHTCEARIEGGEPQLLRKMQAFWEYLLPDKDRKAHKAIGKATSVEAYFRGVNALLRSSFQN